MTDALARLRAELQDMVAKEIPLTFELGAPLTEAEVAAFEARLGVTLPDELRAFVTEVAAHFDTTCGFGLLPLAGGAHHLLQRSPRAPADLAWLQFPISIEAAAESVAAQRAAIGDTTTGDTADGTLAVADAAWIGDNPWAAGAILLCTAGCGWETYLVIEGPHRGTVWASGEPGWRPELRLVDGELRYHSFLSWFEAALRGPW